MIAGPATPLTICAITSSSVIAVKPWPMRPSSVSTSTCTQASEVLRSTPASVMCIGTLSGVAVTRAIFWIGMRWSGVCLGHSLCEG